jgi:hypothetical protein
MIYTDNATVRDLLRDHLINMIPLTFHVMNRKCPENMIFKRINNRNRTIYPCAFNMYICPLSMLLGVLITHIRLLI